MAIKTYKPTTPSRRHMTVSAFEGIDKKAKPERSLLESLKKNAGRNSYGRITVRHRGGGNKKKYRIIDFKRDKAGKATVINLQYDPNRSANIALIEYEDGERRYILAPVGLKAGSVVTTGSGADILPGNAMPIAEIPVGEVIHCIELYPGKGAQLVRSAGTAAQLMAKENGMAQVRLPSGEVRLVRENCMATIGQVGNTDWANIHIGKAGRKRHMGWRPTVRGSVMNPNDYLKVKEFLMKRRDPGFKKSQRDDLFSMETGLLQFKGRVHFQLTPRINSKLDQIGDFSDKNRAAKHVGCLIDQAIHRSYEIFEINYVAFDLLHNTDRFARKYTPEKKEEIVAYFNKQLEKVDVPDITPEEREYMWQMMLTMYSNPLRNKLRSLLGGME